MKILIYGFEPYGNWEKNISEEIINRIRKQKDLTKLVLPVRFERKMFMNELRRIKPSLILGIGQHPRGEKLRIERKAANLKKESKENKPKIIFKNNPRYKFMNLKLKKDKNSWVSYDAGTYVCNFFMYFISNYCDKKNIRFAFIHVPYNYNLNKAAKFVNNKISEVTNS